VLKSTLFFLFTSVISCISFAQGNSLSLSGPVNWVNAGNISVTGQNITVEAMIHMTGASVNIVSKHTGPPNTNYLLRPQTFDITTTNGYASLANPVILQQGVTYHVAATYNGSVMRYYVNGCLTAEQPWTGTLITNALATAIGQQSNCQCEQFIGFIDEVRIWNVARTELQIRNNMYNIVNPALQFNLVAYFKFQNNYNNLSNFPPAVSQVGSPTLVPIPYAYPSALALSHTGSNVICNNSLTGAIDLDASGGYLPYQYSIDGVNFQTSPEFPNLAAGTYTVYVKSNDNCIAQAQRIIQNKTPINPNLNASNVACNGESNGSATVAPTGGNGAAYSVEWFDGSSGNSISGLAPGTYSVSIRDSCRVAGNELINNGHFEQGVTGFTSAYSSCVQCVGNFGGQLFENQYVVGLNANFHHSAFAGTGQGGAGNFMVVNGSSLSNTDVWCQTVSVEPNTYYEFSAWVSSVFSQSPAQLQFEANGVLLGPVFSAPNAVNTWNQFFSVWFSGSNTSVNICIINQNTSVAGNDFGIDNISFKACYSCEITQEFTIIEPQPLTASGVAQNAVCGTNTGSVVVSAQDGTAAYMYSIDGVNYSNNNTIIGLSPGAYSVYVQDASFCIYTFSVIIGDEDQITLEAGNDVGACIGGEVTLNASGTAGFSWSDNVVNNQPFVPANSQYYYVELDLGPSCYALDSVFVTVWPLPTVSAGDDQGVCSGEGVLLNATGALNYVWSNGASNGLPSFPAVGNYILTVTGTDVNGCNNTDDMNLIIYSAPNADLTATPTDGFTPLPVDFENLSGTGANYSLNYGEGLPFSWSTNTNSYSYNTPGLYWSVLTAESNGCSSYDSILITVFDASFVFELPNVFTPNGDEVNAFFQLMNPSGFDQLVQFEVLIINRWGQTIKTYDTFDFLWDGRDEQNNLVKEGVYFYKIFYKLNDGSEDTLQGFVHVVY